MISRIEGVLYRKAPTRVVVDVGGVGYEAHIPLSTYDKLPDEGERVALHIHTHVREEAFLLYGFADEFERTCFEMLLHVSRLGPKLAQTILSGIDCVALLSAICNKEVGVLSGVHGVGARTAERMVVELQDRAAALVPPSAAEGEPPVPKAPDMELRDQLISALLNLQVQRARAERVADAALEELGKQAPIEALVRVALGMLSK